MIIKIPRQIIMREITNNHKKNQDISCDNGNSIKRSIENLLTIINLSKFKNTDLI